MGGRRERIVVALDVGAEMWGPWDARRGEEGPSRFAVVLVALQNWVTQKLAVSPRSEFAICAVGASRADAPTPWSSERDLVLATLGSIEPFKGDAPTTPVDLSTLFDTLNGHFRGDEARSDDDEEEEEKEEEDEEEEEGVLKRCVLVFGRSDVVPIVSRGVDAHGALLHDARFCVDVLYVHKRVSATDVGTNQSQEIYDSLNKLGDRPEQNQEKKIKTGGAPSYYFETTSSLSKLNKALATMLVRPDLRHPQPQMLHLFNPIPHKPLNAPPPDHQPGGGPAAPSPFAQEKSRRVPAPHSPAAPNHHSGATASRKAPSPPLPLPPTTAAPAHSPPVPAPAPDAPAVTGPPSTVASASV